jgi:hypothetical protein
MNIFKELRDRLNDFFVKPKCDHCGETISEWSDIRTKKEKSYHNKCYKYRKRLKDY